MARPREVHHNGKCPKCRSTYLTKQGFMWYKGKKRQRYRCQNCGHITRVPKE